MPGTRLKAVPPTEQGNYINISPGTGNVNITKHSATDKDFNFMGTWADKELLSFTIVAASPFLWDTLYSYHHLFLYQISTAMVA